MRCKVIREIDLSTAANHDINQLENLIDMSNTHKDIFADKGFNPRVQHKKPKGKPMGKRLEKRNKTIAQKRFSDRMTGNMRAF